MQEMTEALAERLAQRFAALADPSRLRILHALHDGELAVGELSRRLAIGQASMSKHLAQLRQEGLVEVRRAGAQAFYRIHDPQLFDLCALVCDGVRRHADERRSSLTTSPESIAP